MPRNFIFRINNCSLAERGDDLSRCESHSPSNNIKVTKYSRLPCPLVDVYVRGRVLQLTSVFKISPTITLPGIRLPSSALCVYLFSVTLNQQNKCRDSQLSLFVLHRAVQSACVSIDSATVLPLQSWLYYYWHAWLLGPLKTIHWGLSIKWARPGQSTLRVYGVFLSFKLLFIERAWPL